MQTELTYSAFESRYRNKEYIGSGGFAKVYKVFDHAKNHYIALKVADVRPEWNKFTLRNEVELINKLPLNRNIARYDACYRFNTGFTGVMDFAILRFYEYGNLEQFLNKEKLTAEDKKLIIQGILDGMSFLHSHNVIHRDLKAQNILLHREDGVWTPKITDFGLSREILDSGTITNSSIGISYAYAAPEQIQNKKIHRNVDVWAAGVIIYRIIAGELPFKGMSEGDHKSAQSQLELSKKIVNLELPEKLETLEEPYRSIVKRCLVLDPLQRAQGAEELINLLRGEAADSMPFPVSTKPAVDEQTAIIEQGAPASEATEIIERQPEREAPIANTPTPAAPMPPATQPPSGYGHTGNDYGIPKDNVTQILSHKAKEASKPPPVTTNFKPTMGEPSRGFRWWWIALPILLLSVGGGVWWTMRTGPITQSPPITQPVNVNSALSPNKLKRLTIFEAKLTRAKTAKRTLPRLEKELLLLQKDPAMMTHYKIYFIAAKLRSMQNNSREISKALKKSAEFAVKKGQAKELLAELEMAEPDYFQEFIKINQGKHWKSIIEALKISLK